MVLVRETVPEDWQALRDIRLAALRDAPDAFGSTYEEQAAFGEADWRRRIANRGTFLAYLPEVSAPEVSAPEGSAPEVSAPEGSAAGIRASEPVGLVGGYQAAPGVIELVSMYVRPEARGRGVGEAMIEAVIGWSRARHATTVHLWVTETNKHACRLYERCGFSLTGERQPLPSNENLTEFGMSRTL
jgi:GNAT superfamily N-acetyltransferase